MNEHMKFNLIITKKDCVLFFLWIFPIIDCINGYLMNVLNFQSFGVFFRIGMICIYLSVLLTTSYKSNLKIIFISFILFLCFSIYHYFKQGDSISVLLSASIKYWLLFVTIETIYSLNIRGIIKEEDIHEILRNLSFLFPVLFLLPKFFLSAEVLYTYGDSGYKGLFNSTNAITFVFSMLLTYSFLLLKKNVKMLNIIRVIFNAIALAMIGTKTGYIIIIFIFLWYLIMILRTKKINGFLMAGVIVLVVIITVFVFWRVYNTELQLILNRWRYFKNRSSSFFSFLSSGRTDRLKYISEYHSKAFGYYVFGIGQIGFSNMSLYAEMDFFDLYYTFGILIFIMYILYFIRLFLIRRDNEYLFVYFIALLIPFFSGHVLSDSMGNTMLAIMILVMICKNKELKKN